VSYDDIDLFSRLRSMTIVKGIQMGPKVSAYMEHFSKVGDIPLYTGLAM
jgi:glutaredoxin 2